MNKIEWLELLNENWDELHKLIRKYHPAYGFRNKNKDGGITASFAEKACQDIRQEIAVQSPPTIDIELLKQNSEQAYRILNEVWFGIPESISEVKKIGPIFNVLCNLCEGFED